MKDVGDIMEDKPGMDGRFTWMEGHNRLATDLIMAMDRGSQRGFGVEQSLKPSSLQKSPQKLLWRWAENGSRLILFGKYVTENSEVSPMRCWRPNDSKPSVSHSRPFDFQDD